MSVILNSKLSAYETLKSEFPAKVVEAQADGRSMKAFSSHRIAVINLMPTKEATERQWSKLMMASHLWIEPVWIRMKSHTSVHVAQDYLETHYVTIDEVDLSMIEGVILTGAPVELMAFEEVNYWQELCQIIDSVTKAHIPILAVCWGAQALLYKRYGIEKITLGEKCFGVYEHKTKTGHPLTQAIAEKIYLPHSRHTGWCVETLQKHEQLEIIIESEEAGVFALEDGEGDWYWSGHPEYETDTLLLEYHRDLNKGLSIVAPRGYQEKKRDEWVVETPWQETASCLLCNWINAIVPRELGNHDKRRY